MPETKAQRSAAARKGAETRKRHEAESRQREQASAVVDRTSELSDEVLKSLESGLRAAIEAVRKFIDTVDEALPAIGERPSRRQRIIDGALEMADRLVHTQYAFLRDVVQDAGRALSREGTTTRERQSAAGASPLCGSPPAPGGLPPSTNLSRGHAATRAESPLLR